MSRGLDLSKPDDVLRYLSETPFASSQVESLSGGNINYVFRLYLRNPYDGKRTLIMKHGKGWPSGHETYSFSVERMSFEARALEIVNTALPHDAVARAPRLHHYDKEEHVLIVEDCGTDTHTLKHLLKEGLLDIQACRTVGRALGTFLATIHRECSKDLKLLEYLDKNTKMKSFGAPLTRVVSTLTGDRKTRTGEAIVDPPLVSSLPEGTIQIAEKIVQEITRAMEGAAAQRVFTMGDFHTQNIVVRTSGRRATGSLKVERIFVIDWEDTKPGLPYMDFGQFVAEMHSLRRFYENTTRDLVDATLKEYFTAYKEGYPIDDVFLRGATAQIGAHLIEATPVGWEPKEKIRAVVAEGVEYLVMSRQKKLSFLKESAIRHLVGEL